MASTSQKDPSCTVGTCSVPDPEAAKHSSAQASQPREGSSWLGVPVTSMAGKEQHQGCHLHERLLMLLTLTVTPANLARLRPGVWHSVRHTRLAGICTACKGWVHKGHPGPGPRASRWLECQFIIPTSTESLDPTPPFYPASNHLTPALTASHPCDCHSPHRAFPSYLTSPSSQSPFPDVRSDNGSLGSSVKAFP